jgi:hypothetical protein
VQFKHRDGASGVGVTGELGADHTGRVQPEAVTIELERPFMADYGQVIMVVQAPR